MSANYRKQVYWSAEDESWVATTPDFPGLSAVGDSDVDAISELNSLVEEAIRIHKEEGWVVPIPSEEKTEYSGQIRLRLPKSVHALAAQRADLEGISLNSFLQTAIAYSIGMSHGLDDMERRACVLVSNLRTSIDLQALAIAKGEEAWHREKPQPISKGGGLARYSLKEKAPGKYSPSEVTPAFEGLPLRQKRLDLTPAIPILPEETIK